MPKYICPRCGVAELEQPAERNALSRTDNKTYICSDCGTSEAMVDAGFEEPIEWAVAQ